MVRNQVYFDDELDRELKLLVAMGDGSFSELVREGAWKVVAERKNAKKVKKFDPWKDFIGLSRGGIKTNAVKEVNDYYLNFGK